MNKKLSRLFMLVFGLLANMVVSAQEAEPQMADIMRSNGKIYVVVAVCLTILLGLFLYVYLIDRKINRLENNKD